MYLLPEDQKLASERERARSEKLIKPPHHRVFESVLNNVDQAGDQIWHFYANQVH